MLLCRLNILCNVSMYIFHLHWIYNLQFGNNLSFWTDDSQLFILRSHGLLNSEWESKFRVNSKLFSITAYSFSRCMNINHHRFFAVMWFIQKSDLWSRVSFRNSWKRAIYLLFTYQVSQRYCIFHFRQTLDEWNLT